MSSGMTLFARIAKNTARVLTPNDMNATDVVVCIIIGLVFTPLAGFIAFLVMFGFAALMRNH